MHIFKHTNYDFIKYRVHALVLSWVIILAGLGVIWTKGIPKGVEFSGGTIVIVKFAQPTDIDRVRAVLPGGRRVAARRLRRRRPKSSEIVGGCKAVSS